MDSYGGIVGSFESGFCRPYFRSTRGASVRSRRAKTGRGLFEHGDAEAVARQLRERDRFLVRLLKLKAATGVDLAAALRGRANPNPNP